MGEAKGEANALLRVLTARGFIVNAATEARVRNRIDLVRSNDGVTRAVTAPSLVDVFDDG
jgi:hypothetical protein